MKKKYYWKVVKKNMVGAFYSAILEGWRFHLSYKIGEKTNSAMPENGIFVFDTRARARQWRNKFLNFKDFAILKVEVLGEEIPWDKMCIYCLFNLEFDGRKVPHSYAKPEGTTSFPSVIPVEISH